MSIPLDGINNLKVSREPVSPVGILLFEPESTVWLEPLWLLALPYVQRQTQKTLFLYALKSQ